jgi:ubiquinone/menaquinone biosynthesis C-methylase UbiE
MDMLPLADRSVDRILAVNVAYFFGSDGMTLAEMRRVLKPDGKLVVYVTSEKSMRNWRFASVKTHRFFDESKLRICSGRGASKTGSW